MPSVCDMANTLGGRREAGRSPVGDAGALPFNMSCWQ